MLQIMCSLSEGFSFLSVLRVYVFVVVVVVSIRVVTASFSASVIVSE